MQQRRVLLVDPDEAVLRLLERLVHRYRPCLRAASVGDAKYAIESARLCGLIVDPTLAVPRDGLDVVRAFRAAYPDAPILVLAHTVCDDTAATVFDTGAKIITKRVAAKRINSFAMQCVCADTEHTPVLRDVLADWACRAKLTVKEVEIVDGALRGRRVEWFVQHRRMTESAYGARRMSLLRKLPFASIDEAVITLLSEALSRATSLELSI